MSSFDAFNEILQRDEPLAPYTWLNLGGPAQYLFTPRSIDELTELVRALNASQTPIRILGGGSNLLVKDEGVSGAVIRLTSPAFAEVSIEGSRVRAGCGALLSHVISETVRLGLAGFENLAGIPGTVGGALAGNSGGRLGEISQLIDRVTGLTLLGERVIRTKVITGFLWYWLYPNAVYHNDSLARKNQRLALIIYTSLGKFFCVSSQR